METYRWCALDGDTHIISEEGMAAHSRILAWRIPMDRGTWRVLKRKTRLPPSRTVSQKCLTKDTKSSYRCNIPKFIFLGYIPLDVIFSSSLEAGKEFRFLRFFGDIELRVSARVLFTFLFSVTIFKSAWGARGGGLL